jgi:hypothetical protein
MLLYEGPSLITGEDIVVIAIPDRNPKTRRMLFTYVLLQGKSPEVAAHDGSDRAICGDCKFRAAVEEAQAANLATLARLTAPYAAASERLIDHEHLALKNAVASRRCYVRLTGQDDVYGKAADEAVPPDEVWRMWKNGEFSVRPVDGGWYPDSEWDWEPKAPPCGRVYVNYRGPLPVRIGSYGDPAAVPTRVWAELVRYAKNWTGYSHAHKTCDQDLRRYCMASCDNTDEYDDALSRGWRPFLVVPEGQEGPGEDAILCPATRGLSNCAKCMLCKGSSVNARPIWERVHGINASNFTSAM